MTRNSQIVIIDYGIGNIGSVVRAFTHFNTDVLVSDKPDDILNARAIVLPGVGSFKSGMRGLKDRGLTGVILDCVNKHMPVLGICLGAQILMNQGHEFGIYDGLGIIPGKVAPFPDLEHKEKIPHMGWNALQKPLKISWDHTILRSTQEGDKLYFVHSYILQPSKKENILSLTTYGSHEFCSAVRKGNVYGVQFHPEKSGKHGLNIIKEFINLSKGEST